MVDNDTFAKVEDVAELETLATNQDYLEPRSFHAPRTIRIGMGAAF